MARRLRYSERRRLAETGSLGDLVYEDPPQVLRYAILHLYRQSERVTKRFAQHFQNVSVEHFGLPGTNHALNVIASGDSESFLDGLEIMVEASTQREGYLTDFEERLNDLCDRHRFGFRIVGGEAQRLGSPALTEVIVGPALLAAQQAGWEEVEKSYREALSHQRGGPDENDDALTAANAALEAALKAAGLKGKELGALAKELRKSDLVPGQLAGVPEALDALLKRSGALRNTLSDAHGKAPGDGGEVEQAVVDLAVHLVGSFIVYLSRVAPSS